MRYMVYMRVSLFGLFSQHTNLMNPHLSLYNWFCPQLLYMMPHCKVRVCSRHKFLIYAFLIWIYRHTCACLCKPLGFILCTHWVAFSDNPWTCMSRFQSLDHDGSFRGYQSGAAVTWLISCLFPDLSPLDQLSIFPFTASELLPAFVPCKIIL